MDKIEARLALAQPFVAEALDIAREAKSIDNLPEYINQSRYTLEDRLKNTIEGLLSTVDSIRRKIPAGALEAERKRLSYGTRRNLV